MPPVPILSQVDKYCRLCLQSDPWDIPLLIRQSIKTTINEVLGIEVRTSEKLPKVICHRCLSKLDFFLSFKKDVEKSFRLLRDFGLDNSRPSSPTQPVTKTNSPPRTISKNRITKSCPLCPFKTGNPVDYRKHQEDHKNGSEKDNTVLDSDELPPQEEKENIESVSEEKENKCDKDKQPVLICDTYYPCLECNMFLIPSREKLLEHKIKEHGWKESDDSRIADGGSSRGDEGSREEEGSKVDGKGTEENEREKSREKNEELEGSSTDSLEDRPMPQLERKNRLLLKRKIPKKSISHRSNESDESSSSSSSTYRVSVVKGGRRPRPILDSNSESDDDDDDDEGGDNAKDAEEQQRDACESNNDASDNDSLGSDEKIQLLIDNHMESLIKDSAVSDAAKIHDENGKRTSEVENSADKPECASTAGKIEVKTVKNKNEVMCDLCERPTFFPNLSILASHKRRLHGTATSSTEKKVEVSSSVDDAGGVGEAQQKVGIKWLQDGGSIVKRSQNGVRGYKRSYSASRMQNNDNRRVKRSLYDDRKVVGHDDKKLEKCSKSGEQESCVNTYKKQQNDKSFKSSDNRNSRSSQDGDNRGHQDGVACVSKPQDGGICSNKQQDGVASVNKPQDGGTSVAKLQDGNTSVNKQQDGVPSVNKPQDGSASENKSENGGNTLQDSNKKLVERKVPCDLCDRHFVNFPSMLNHRRDVHGFTTSENNVTCNLCSERFSSQGALVFHNYKVHEK